MLGRVALVGISPLSTEPIRTYKGRQATIRVLFANQSGKAKQLRVAFNFPESFEVKEEQRFQLPAAGSYAVEWILTPHRRGRYVLDRCYLETPSPLGFWDIRQEKPLSLELLVYPNLRTPEGLLALRKGLAGVHAQRQVGQGREFENSRR